MTSREEWLEDKCVAAYSAMMAVHSSGLRINVLRIAMDEALHYGYQQAVLEKQPDAPKAKALERPRSPNVVHFSPHQELTPYRLVQLLRESARIMGDKYESDLKASLPGTLMFNWAVMVEEVVHAIEKQIGPVDD